MPPKNILVLCTGNSCRSQLLHGYLQRFLGEKAHVYSAGVEVHGLNPRAVRVMAEDGVDISQHTSNHVEEYAQVPFDYVLTVCDHANEVCPVFPSSAQKLHHNFPDPAKATGSEEEIMSQFRHVRDQVKQYVQDFAKASFLSSATIKKRRPVARAAFLVPKPQLTALGVMQASTAWRRVPFPRHGLPLR